MVWKQKALWPQFDDEVHVVDENGEALRGIVTALGFPVQYEECAQYTSFSDGSVLVKLCFDLSAAEVSTLLKA
jgi:hypothetical protein